MLPFFDELGEQAPLTIFESRVCAQCQEICTVCIRTEAMLYRILAKSGRAVTHAYNGLAPWTLFISKPDWIPVDGTCRRDRALMHYWGWRGTSKMPQNCSE